MLVCLSAAAQEKEAALGKQLAQDFRSHSTAIDNPTVQKYVDALGQQLADQMPDRRFPFTFGVVADDPCPSRHAPTAFPGGYVFVPAALFLAAGNEVEFAQMLAHAMAHIVQGFPKLQNNKDGPLIYVVRSCDSTAIPIGLTATQRAAESDADTLATEVMAKTSIAPSDAFDEVRRILTPRVRPKKPPTLRR